MTELKTLKDIGQSKRKCCSIEEDYNNICEKCLKAEAIKWVKSNNTGGFSFDIDFEGKVIRHHRKKKSLNSIDWTNIGAMIELINFFNITEEDLQ